jgi:hypothetical protein
MEAHLKGGAPTDATKKADDTPFCFHAADWEVKSLLRGANPIA